MARSLTDLGLVEPNQELAVEIRPGDQARFSLEGHRFGGYLWYIEEVAGGTVMLMPQENQGQNAIMFNLFAFGPLGTSRVVLREARPFSPESELHSLILYVSVVAEAAITAPA